MGVNSIRPVQPDLGNINSQTGSLNEDVGETGLNEHKVTTPGLPTISNENADAVDGSLKGVFKRLQKLLKCPILQAFNV